MRARPRRITAAEILIRVLRGIAGMGLGGFRGGTGGSSTPAAVRFGGPPKRLPPDSGSGSSSRSWNTCGIDALKHSAAGRWGGSPRHGSPRKMNAKYFGGRATNAKATPEAAALPGEKRRDPDCKTSGKGRRYEKPKQDGLDHNAAGRWGGSPRHGSPQKRMQKQFSNTAGSPAKSVVVMSAARIGYATAARDTCA